MASKRAIVVGIDEYRDDRISVLQGARNDAREMHEVLAQDPEFELDPPLLGKEATGDAIRTAMSDLLWRTNALDLALFYFSGHAFDDTYRNGFLAPFDMDYERPLVHGIRMQELNDLMRKAVNKAVVLVILDACKSGIAASGDKGPPEDVSIEHAFDIQKGVENDEAKGRVVLASSGPDEKSIELSDCRHEFIPGDAHPHGAFTYHMLEGLSGAAASDNADVTLSALHSYVERELKSGQHVTFFGSGLQNSQNIHLVRATNFAAISKAIAKAEELFNQHKETQDSNSLFWAAHALVRMRAETANNNRALSIRMQIDEELRAQSDSALWYVTRNKPELGPDCFETCRRLETLLADLSVDSLAESKDMLGLLMTLWQAAASADDAQIHKDLRRQMVAVEKHLKEPAQVRPSQPNPGAAA
jgi:uncharacterized caspase-like protein